MENRDWVVYLIRCADASLYCGITNNLQKRLAEHDSGKGAKYIRSRRPVELVAASSKMSKSDALKFEYQVKQLPSGKKIIELNKGKEKSMDIKQELVKVNREIQSLTKKVEKLIVAAGKLEKAKIIKAKPAKRTAEKKAALNKPAKLTAIDAVLAVIKRSKKGADTATLIQKTGFNEKKIFNNVYKLKKQGKIKAEKKGFYKIA